MKLSSTLINFKNRRGVVKRNYYLVAALLLIIMVTITGCTQTASVSQLNSSSNMSSSNSLIAPTASTPSILYNEDMLVSIYERTMPSVVKIEAVITQETQTIGPFQFGPYQQEGQGSGFIIDEQGHILTNNHVIEGASSVKVILDNDNVFDAKVVGTDRENDLALLKIESDKIGNTTPIPLGDSSNIKPGQIAIALGAPFGLDGSITVGIVSATGRSITSTTRRIITDMIQTDAAINPGNSGGPLLNSKGEVIGINTAIEASATGIGYAIPVNTAKSLLPALKKGGEVGNPWLGISGTAISANLASELDLAVNSGVYVIEVTPDSPAEKVGLRGSGTDSRGQPTFGGDVIIGVDGIVVTKVENLVTYFNSKKPDDEVSLLIYRGDENLTIKVTLGEWPE